MKKFISLMLFFAMLFTFAYAEKSEELILPSIVTNMSRPTGGIEPDINPPAQNNHLIQLNGVEEMSDFEKYLYDAIYEQNAIIDIYSYRISPTGFRDWFLKYAFKHPELMLIDGGFSTTRKNGYISTVSPAYSINKSNRESFISIMNQKLDEYYNLVKDEDDELKKYLLIYSKMARETHYDYSYETNKAAHTVYSFFVNGATTCQGYSNALMMIGEKVGLEVSCCFNRNSNVGHIWNYIKINGKWYHTDVTWGDYSAPLENGAYNNENDQGTVYSHFLCSDDAYTSNGHGSKSDFISFEDELIPCTDKTYESDQWAFNLKAENNGLYLMDFEYESGNLFFDLVGAKDSNGNKIKFVTNNLWGNDTYLSEPLINTSSAKYYMFSEKDIQSAKLRLVLKNDDKIKSVVSMNVTDKSKQAISSITVPVESKVMSDSSLISAHLWNSTTPLAEKITVNK